MKHYALPSLALLLLAGCAGTQQTTCHAPAPVTHEAAPKPQPVVAPVAKDDPLAHRASAQIYAAVDTGNGMGEYLGRVEFTDTAQGLQITVNLKGIPSGEHGFHVHEIPDCSPMMQNGKMTCAMAAGGHFDPEKTGKHLGPEGGGHKGDLPFITADANGNVSQTFLVRGVKAALFKNRSIMIHAGGDNYADEPVALGGGGARIACGIIH